MTSLRRELGEILRQACVAAFPEKGETFKEMQMRIDYPPKIDLGHYSSPLAMELAKVLKKAPRKIAESIVEKLQHKYISKVGIEGSGFINIFINTNQIGEFFQQDFSIASWLQNTFPLTQTRIHFEFVSANPTGPLNIVSARAAAVGDSICRVLEATGNQVAREYYVNDAGNQVRLLGLSFAYRYLESLGVSLILPDDCYQGEYITVFSQEVASPLSESIDFQDCLKKLSSTLDSKQLQNSDEEKKAIEDLGSIFQQPAIQSILNTQQSDLKNFRIDFDLFFSEKTLHEGGQVLECYEALKAKGVLYESDGAWFFKSTDYGDDKDRVVKRADKTPTYFLADIAYHRNKVTRGFQKLYDIWGPDHHGYIARLQGAIKALGFGDANNESFDVLIVQQVNLKEGGKKVEMSKRLGKFQTMADLINDIGVDVSRFFFLNRSQSTHLDFDLELARDNTKKNPVHYIHYAHARIHSIFREVGLDIKEELSYEIEDANWLKVGKRDHLAFHLLRFVELLEEVSKSFEVHRLTSYLYETAELFTAFYHEKDKNKIVDLYKQNPGKAMPLLILCQRTVQVLAKGLELLGISAPEKM